jgi:hypothetical protein
MPLLFNFALEYATRKDQEIQVGMIMNGKHHLLVYTDDLNKLGCNIVTTKKNTEALTDASKQLGLEVCTEKTKYTLTCRHHNARQYHNIKIANKYFQNWHTSNIWERH